MLNMGKLELVIDTDELNALVGKGGQLELTEEAEEAIFKVIAIRDRAEEALALIKKAIVEKGRNISPEFKGIVGADIKGYIKQGEKYTAEDKRQVPEFALKSVSYKKLDQKAIEDYEKEKGKLPHGVEKKEDVTSFVLQYDKQRAKETALQLQSSTSVSKKPRRSLADVSAQTG